METNLRDIAVEVKPPGKVQYGNDQRAHTLIKHRKTGEAFVDIVPFSFGGYFTPSGYEFHAWVIVPSDKEIGRNYELEKASIGSVFTRGMVAITNEEFDQLAAAMDSAA